MYITIIYGSDKGPVIRGLRLGSVYPPVQAAADPRLFGLAAVTTPQRRSFSIEAVTCRTRAVAAERTVFVTKQQGDS
jgi:hypothetical protein